MERALRLRHGEELYARLSRYLQGRGAVPQADDPLLRQPGEDEDRKDRF